MANSSCKEFRGRQEILRKDDTYEVELFCTPVHYLGHNVGSYWTRGTEFEKHCLESC